MKSSGAVTGWHDDMTRMTWWRLTSLAAISELRTDPALRWLTVLRCGGCCWLLWCWRSAVVLRPATAVTTLRSNTDTAVARHIAGKSIADAALIIPEKGDLSLGEGPRTCFVQFPSFHKMSLEWVFCHFKPNHCWTLFRVTSYLKEF